jgi:hypothetical protein
MDDREEQIADALRDLVARIYQDCKGAYGAECGYLGHYEDEIQALAKAVSGRL